MAKSNVTITLKTPHTTVKTKDLTKASQMLSDEIAKRAVKIVVPKVSQSVKVVINRSVAVAATFFQRVCARTPIDADYTDLDKNGNEHIHEADNIQCRLDWYLDCNGVKITARDLYNQRESIFDKYNDKDAIDFIRDVILDKIMNLDINKIDISIGNENPYFATLEYGGYDVSDSKIKVDSDGIGHGVKNSHSVQAPVGMLRITQMELSSMVASNAKTPLSTRFRRQSTTQELSDERLMALMAKFKASKRLPLSDIKRYVGL